MNILSFRCIYQSFKDGICKRYIMMTFLSVSTIYA